MAGKQYSEARLNKVARENLGFESLRPGQVEALQAVLAGRDTLVVMPTGSGKSAIYEIANLLLPGPAVIVSPLIALQQDQVESIDGEDIGEAAMINASKGERARRETLERLDDGDLDFLFLAPEQFNNAEVRESIKEAQPSLIVVDEAHCISEWGHDFRPEYLRLGAVIEDVGHPTVLAMTATASPPVRAEIVERLGMRDPAVVVQGFDRPNIWLGVERHDDERAKRRAVLEAVAGAEKPGIVYASTRKHAEEIAADLRGKGIRTDHYHAGMKRNEREEVQQDFMEGDTEVMVATSAFGMGIDKANVRFVFHHDIPNSVDAYYQEIGRAGRDGEPARAVLFYRPGDLNIHRFFAGGGQVDVEQVEQVAEAIDDAGEPVEPSELTEATGLSEAKVTTAVSRLEDVGAVELLPTGEVAEAGRSDVADRAEEATEEDERRRQVEASQIEMMRGYAEVWDCRRKYILNYFGEPFQAPCGNCDNCDRGIVVQDDRSKEPFAMGSRVAHTALGEGVVERYEGDKVTVLFDEGGYKSLDLEFVLSNGVLKQVEARGQKG